MIRSVLQQVGRFGHFRVQPGVVGAQKPSQTTGVTMLVEIVGLEEATYFVHFGTVN